MILKFVLLILLLNARNVVVEVNESFAVIPIAACQSDSHENLEERLRKIEHYLGNHTINHLQLQEVKDEIVAELEDHIDNKLKVYDTRDQIMAKFETIIDSKLKAYDENRMSTDFESMKKEIFALIREASTPPRERDCRHLLSKGYRNSGIYLIRPELAIEEFLVWCDMTTNGGGWTYVVNRFDGSQDFYRNWTDYKHGFGTISGEHWLGLDHLFYLTNSKRNELLFELIDWDSRKVHAIYDNFKIKNESEGYQISSIGNYKGDTGNCFKYHLNYKFSTRDRGTNSSCAASMQAGWWYHDCYHVHLTGKYVENPTPGKEYDGVIQWYGFHGYNYSLKEARMMIRPVSL